MSYMTVLMYVVDILVNWYSCNKAYLTLLWKVLTQLKLKLILLIHFIGKKILC